MTLTIASLHIYPIKSLGGFNVKEARITDRGFEHDRRWMLIDANGRFISQREAAAMACLHCSPTESGFRVTDIRDNDTIDLPWGLDRGETQRVSIWNDEVDVLIAPVEVSAWFADKLGITCGLVYMPERAHRAVDHTYATGITSLSDGFPYLILSRSSLEDLNARIASADPHIGSSAHLPMDRFRPNIVIAGGDAYQEDAWKHIAIGDTRFSLVKPCARCAIPTIDQRTGEQGKEPTRTLATYRRRTGSEGQVKVEFGMNAMAIGGDIVNIGDPVHA
jgi:uncharacterized protein YcbX